MVKQAKIHDQQILELNRERKKLVLIGLFNRFFSICLFSANFLPLFFSFYQDSASHSCHITSIKSSNATCSGRCLYITAFSERCHPGRSNNCLITHSYRDANPMTWRPAADLLPLHVFVQSLAISNLIPNFVCSSKYSSLSICILNPSISVSEANLIFYFSPAHPSLLMVFFAAPPTFSIVSL